MPTDTINAGDSSNTIITKVNGMAAGTAAAPNVITVQPNTGGAPYRVNGSLAPRAWVNLVAAAATSPVFYFSKALPAGQWTSVTLGTSGNSGWKWTGAITAPTEATNITTLFGQEGDFSATGKHGGVRFSQNLWIENVYADEVMVWKIAVRLPDGSMHNDPPKAGGLGGTDITANRFASLNAALTALGNSVVPNALYAGVCVVDYADAGGGAIYMRQNPSSFTRVELTDATQGNGVNPSSNVTLRGLKFFGAKGRGIDCTGSTGVTIDTCTASGCEIGMKLDAGAQLLNSTITWNSHYGITGKADNGLIDGGELSYNDCSQIRLADNNGPFESGGSKITSADKLEWRNMEIHHNWTCGIWGDINNTEWNVHHNNVHGNGLIHKFPSAVGTGLGASGYSVSSNQIWYEIGYGRVNTTTVSNVTAFPARFHDNTVDGEGNPNARGVFISTSMNCAVEANTIVNCGLNPIHILDRFGRSGTQLGNYPKHGGYDNVVRNNPRVDLRTGNILVESSGRSAADSPNIAWTNFTASGNAYQLTSLSQAAFTWRGSSTTLNGWNGALLPDGTPANIQNETQWGAGPPIIGFQTLTGGGRKGNRVDSSLGLSALQAELDHQATLGTQVIRVAASWPTIEQTQTTPATRDFTGISNVVTECTSRSMDVVLTVNGNPGWNQTLTGTMTVQNARPPRTTTELNNWAAFITALVTRFGTTVKLYEIWVEPDQNWVSATTNGAAPNISEYSRLLQRAYAAAKAVNTSAMIGGPNTRNSYLGWLTTMYADMDTQFTSATAAANNYYFDVLCMHPYALTHDAALTTPADDLADTFGTRGRLFLDYRRMRTAQTTKEGAGKAKALYFGEFGYSTTTAPNGPVSDATRSTYLTNAYTAVRADTYVYGMTIWTHANPSAADYDIHGAGGTASEAAYQAVGASSTAASFVKDKKENTTAATTSLSISVPAPTFAVGDIELLAADVSSDGAPFNLPTGGVTAYTPAFTQISTTGQGHSLGVWTRVIAAGDIGTAATVSITGATARVINAVRLSVGNVSATTVLDVTPTTSFTSSATQTSIAAPSITTTSAKTRLVNIVTFKQATAALPAATISYGGTDLNIDDQVASGRTQANNTLIVATGALSTAGATGTKTYTSNQTGNLMAATVALRDAAAVAQAPQSTVAPTVSGVFQQAGVVTAQPGSWNPSPTVPPAYQWARGPSTTGPWTDISGATTSTHTCVGADVNQYLSIKVTATNTVGSTTAQSTPGSGDIVLPLMPSYANDGSLNITGTAIVGQTLTIHPGNWGPANGLPTFDYAWQRGSSLGVGFTDILDPTDGSQINSPTYPLVSADAGQTIRCTVFATNAAGEVVAQSPFVGPVVASVANTVPPSVTPTAPIVGTTMTATAGTWTGTGPITLTYQWQNGTGGTYADIAGATTTSYTAQSTDASKVIRVRERATNAAGNADAFSADTSIVPTPSGPPTNQVPPSIIGQAVQGQVLSATNGSWNGATFYTYQWRRSP